MSNQGMDTTLTPREQLLDLRSVDAQSELGAFVIASAASAQSFLKQRSWGRSYSQVLFGAGMPGMVAAFLVHLRVPMGEAKDEWIWVAGGEMPSAYFVTDQVRSSGDALLIYGQLLRAWVDRVMQDGDLSDVFPFACPRDMGTAARMADRLVLLERALSEANAAPIQGWIDARACPRRLDDWGALGPLSDPADMRGCLVVDSAGRIGIAIARTKRPSQSWLDNLNDRSVASAPPDTVWWSVACVAGGFINCPAFAMTAKGRPPQGLVDMALAHNEHTQNLILEAVATLS